MQEQVANHRLPRRASATPEELAARRTNSYQTANNHRAGYHAGLHPEDAPYMSAQIYQGYDDDSLYDTRLPSSAIRYQTDIDGQVISQGNRRVVIHQQKRPQLPPLQGHKQPSQPPPPKKRRVHWLTFVGLAMFVMLIGWIAISALSQWWQVTQDDWHYGRPRTYQTDMAVGHADSAANPSHFIAVNHNRHVEVIEFQGGDPAKAKIYLCPTTLIGPGQDLAVVIVVFKDVNGDGKLDMLVHVMDQIIVFINDGTQFRPLKPGESINL